MNLGGKQMTEAYSILLWGMTDNTDPVQDAVGTTTISQSDTGLGAKLDIN